MNKRIKTLGLHEWSYDDLIVNFYVTVYGTKELYHNTIQSICNRLGVSEHSFDYQGRNFRYLMNEPTKVLSDFSKRQKEVWEVLQNESRFEIKKIVQKILDEENLSRERDLRLRGLDPNKWRLVK